MFESKINRGRANGYAPLDSGSKVPLSYLPPIQSTIDTGSLATTSSLQTLINKTGSFATTGSNSFYGNQNISGSLIVSGSLVASSTFVNNSNLQLTGSDLIIDDGNLSVSGSINVSGSVNVTNTFVNRGIVDLLQSDLIIDSGSIIVTGSIVVTGSIYADNLNELISSSAQITEFGFISSSQTIDTASFATTGSNTFNGNQTISGSVTIDSGYLILSGSTAPSDLSGSIGNTNGMVTFDDNYLYYCTSDFEPETYRIVVMPGTTYNTHVAIAKSQGIPVLSSNGWSITTQDNTTYVLTGVYSDNDNWDCEIDNLNSTYNGGIQMMTLTNLNYAPADIWKRVSLNPLSSDIISSSAQITSLGFISSSTTINTGSFAITGSNRFNGDQTITGSLNVTNSTTLKGAVAIGTGSGAEGGEIGLAYAQTTSLTGTTLALDIYGDKIRIFEGGGTNRGAYLNVASQSAGVNSTIVTSPNLATIQTITSASYAALTPVSGTLYIIIG